MAGPDDEDRLDELLGDMTDICNGPVEPEPDPPPADE